MYICMYVSVVKINVYIYTICMYVYEMYVCSENVCMYMTVVKINICMYVCMYV